MINFLREFGTSAVIPFSLYEIDGSQLITSAAFTSAMIKLTIDGGPLHYTVNSPVFTNNTFQLFLTTTELSGAKSFITVSDPNQVQFLDTSFLVETFSSSASQFPDFGSGVFDNYSINGESLSLLFGIMRAMACGNIAKSGSNFTFYEPDGSTVQYILSAGSSGRKRIQ